MQERERGGEWGGVRCNGAGVVVVTNEKRQVYKYGGRWQYLVQRIFATRQRVRVETWEYKTRTWHRLSDSPSTNPRLPRGALGSSGRGPKSGLVARRAKCQEDHVERWITPGHDQVTAATISSETNGHLVLSSSRAYASLPSAACQACPSC